MNNAKKIKVLVVDDSKLTLMSLKKTFEYYKDLEIVFFAQNGQEAIEVAAAKNPDIILMDIKMPVMDGIEATKIIKEINSNTKIIMLTSHNDSKEVLDSFKAGANSYCMKEIDNETLETVIKNTYQGGAWLDPAIAHIIISNISQITSTDKNKENILTEREINVLELIAKGLSNSEISEKLYISMNTVKTHIKNIFKKLEVEDRTQAALKALKEKIID